ILVIVHLVPSLLPPSPVLYTLSLHDALPIWLLRQRLLERGIVEQRLRVRFGGRRLVRQRRGQWGRDRAPPRPPAPSRAMSSWPSARSPRSASASASPSPVASTCRRCRTSMSGLSATCRRRASTSSRTTAPWSRMSASPRSSRLPDL